MPDDSMIKLLNKISVQLRNQELHIAKIEQAMSGLTVSNMVRTVPVILGVKDITNAQLYDAYKRGLTLQQLYQLSNGKYTPEQIYKKILSYGGRR